MMEGIGFIKYDAEIFAQWLVNKFGFAKACLVINEMCSTTRQDDSEQFILTLKCARDYISRITPNETGIA